MKTMISRLIVLLVMLITSVIGLAQDGAIDTTFNPTDVGFGDVQTILLRLQPFKVMGK